MSADDLKGKDEQALERQRRARAAATNGAELLDELHAAVTRYVVFPTSEAADAAVLWIAASHAQPAWEHAPRLAAVSPLKRCGKSRLLDVVAETAHRPLITVNATIAAVVRRSVMTRRRCWSTRPTRSSAAAARLRTMRT